MGASTENVGINEIKCRNKVKHVKSWNLKNQEINLNAVKEIIVDNLKDVWMSRIFE